MASSFTHNDKTVSVGDTVKIAYKIKEGERERSQVFQGILIKIRGAGDKMITVRKVSHSGVGVERIIPLSSPYLSSIAVTKKAQARRSKLYFIRDLSQSQIRHKIYRHIK